LWFWKGKQYGNRFPLLPWKHSVVMCWNMCEDISFSISLFVSLSVSSLSNSLPPTSSLSPSLQSGQTRAVPPWAPQAFQMQALSL
jgi:hypothetical protein